MCCVTVLIHQDGSPVALETIQAANRMAKHRGPDGEGYFLDRVVGMGHCRLSVFDLSQEGSQPMNFKDYHIVFNGAIYNYPELKEVLRQRGYFFYSNTDTEVILAAYDYWGATCVEQFNGIWALVIYDARKKQLFASRDRFGVKPLYYCNFAKKFGMVSEIKQFSAMVGWRARMNATRVFEYLNNGYQDHTEETLFQGVFQVPKGSNLIYQLDNHSFEIKPYYRLSEVIASSPASTGLFKDWFGDAICLQMRADVKVGACLSGGLDSSSIVAWMHELSEARQPAFETFSACFDDHRINEEVYIDALQEKYGFEATKIRPAPSDIYRLIPKVVWHQDEPVASASVVAQYLVFERAKESGVKVLLDGQGADELLAGYEKFYYPYLKELFQSRKQAVGLALFRILWTHSWRWHFVFQKAKYLFFKNMDHTHLWIHPSFIPPHKMLFKRSEEATVRQVSLNLLNEVGLQLLLHYEDRNSSAHGLESRVPFLDHRLVAYCLGLPVEAKIKDGVRKQVLRAAMKDVLPEKIAQRLTKIGFTAPPNRWMTSSGIDTAGRLREALANHPKIFRNQHLPINDEEWWRIVSFDEWVKVFNVILE